MAHSIDQAKTPTVSNASWSFGFFALPVVLVIALIALAMIQSVASNWISEAVQAEFVGTDFARPAAPTQIRTASRLTCCRHFHLSSE